MRRFVYQMFENTLGLIVIGIAVFILTLLMRGGLWLGETFVVKYLPIFLQKMWIDPWYVLALLLGGLLLWSWPVPDREPDWEPSPIRRGRQVVRFPRAAPRANYARTSSQSAQSAVSRRPSTSKIRRSP